MSYLVCIPTAGTGSRLRTLTRFVNKSLVSIANRPTLSHLIEQFPEDAEFVIALGYKGHLVREFVELAYPQRKFFFAEVDPFEGPGSGLGLSLLACKQHLQQPFIFISCDTLVRESIPAPDENWMGYAGRAELQPYRTLKVESGLVEAICEKGEGVTATHKSYIGLAGVHEYQTFWAAMEQGGEQAIHSGEAHGLRELLSYGVHAKSFTWYDTGNTVALARARKIYQEPDAPNILEKANEAIWFVDGQVIKFSADEKFISYRVKRAQELQGFVPEVTGYLPHMYRYSKVAGKVLSEVVTLPLFERLLQHCKAFWQRHTLDSSEAEGFRDTCMRFYRDKTLERVELFYSTFTRQDGTEAINGVAMPKLQALLNALDWDWLAEGLPGRFHGDFHFENILWSAPDQRFIFLDWRQDFGGSLTTGDIYYDLAKLNHGLIVCHDIIARNLFEVVEDGEDVSFGLLRKQGLVDCEQHFESFLRTAGYDSTKVNILTALIFLNIAALHHYPYSLLLYYLGKSLLARELAKQGEKHL